MHRWKPIVAVAAFGCLLAACGPVAPDPTVSGPTKTVPPTTAPPPTVSTTTPTTEPNSKAPLAYHWARVGSSALDLGGKMTSTLSAVLAPDQAHQDWQLAGTRTTAGGVSEATVWTSPDALRWSPTALRGGAGGQARAATTWGARTVVVGSVGSGPAAQAAVWISPNPDASFRPVPRSSAFAVPAGTTPDPSAGSALAKGDSASLATTAGPGAVMDTVTAGTLGVFAAGTVNGRQALWYSTNGTSWQRLTKAESVIDKSPGAVVRQVLETSLGVFAVGSITHDGTTDAALWSSGDGIGWRLASIGSGFSGPGDQVLSSVSSFGPNLVVAGGIRLATSWTPASWISPTLAAWGAPSESFTEPTGERLDLSGSVVSALGVSADGSTLAAVGGSPSEQRLWLSKDGINWAPVPFPEAAADDADWTAGAVATTDTTTVVVDPDPGQPRLLVDGPNGWREVSADPAVFGTPETVATPTHLVTDAGRLVMTVDVDQPGQALGNDQSSTKILTSTNGRRWTVAPTGDTFAGQTISDIAVAHKGLVAVGGPSPTTAAAMASGSSDGRAVTVWRSADGVTWSAERLGPHGVIAGSTVQTTGPTPTTAAPTTTAPTTTVPTPSTTAPTTTAPAPTTTAPAAAPTTTARPSTRTTARPAAGSTPGTYQAPQAAVTALGDTVYVAASFGGSPAVGWKSDGGSKWTALGTLDQDPVAEPDTVWGACATPDTAVMVGATANGMGGSTGSAWRISSPASSIAVGPIPPTDSAEQLLGCADTPTGSLVAWGASASSDDGTPTAALWSSSTGDGWDRRPVAAFVGGSGTPAITDVADDGDTWLAVTGSSTEPWTQDPLASLGVWESGDAGKTWRQVPTPSSLFGARFGVSADLVSYFGVDPVIAGQVDGRLAVWVGDPN